MNVMSRVDPSATAECGKTFTYSWNLSGSELKPGLEVNIKAIKPGIYLTSSDRPDAWTRYIAFDCCKPPVVTNNTVLNASISETGYMTAPNKWKRDCLLFVRVFDPMIRSIRDGNLRISIINGTPSCREMVWKKHPTTHMTVGIEAFYSLCHGDTIAIIYPGACDLLTCYDGVITILPNESPIAKKWFAARYRAETTDAINQAKARAMQFPERADWEAEIAQYANRDVAIKEAFLETLFENIAKHLAHATSLGEDTLTSSHLFMLHVLAEVVKYLPKEWLQRARRLLRSMELRLKTKIPLNVTEKFVYEHEAKRDVPLKSNGTTNEKRRRRELNLARRAAENRSRAHGGTGKKPK